MIVYEYKYFNFTALWFFELFSLESNEIKCSGDDDAEHNADAQQQVDLGRNHQPVVSVTDGQVYQRGEHEGGEWARDATCDVEDDGEGFAWG